MKMELVYFGFLILMFSWIPTASGLKCPSCTYLNSNADLYPVVRSILNKILHLFQDPECGQDLKGEIPQIQEEICEVKAEHVSRCSFYKGSMTLTIPLLVTSVNIPFQMYQRGCYYSKPANVPSNGCHKRSDVNEDRTIIKQILDKASTVFENYEVAKFDGEMCLCTSTYCSDTSGVRQGAVFSSVLLLVSVFVSCIF